MTDHVAETAEAELPRSQRCPNCRADVALPEPIAETKQEAWCPCGRQLAYADGSRRGYVYDAERQPRIPTAHQRGIEVLDLRVTNASGYPLEYATAGAIGLDLRACIGEQRSIPPGRRFAFDTGIGIELPAGYGALVQPRSGLGLHHGVVALTGVIDRDYRGTIRVVLVNLGLDAYTVRPGDRIAQLVVLACPQVAVRVVDELSETDRGRSGFGSTGL